MTRRTLLSTALGALALLFTAPMAFAGAITYPRIQVGLNVRLLESGEPLLNEDGVGLRYWESSGTARTAIATPRTSH